MVRIMKVNNEQIKREKGYLYYLGKDGYVWASPMKFNKTGTKKRVGNTKVTKVKGAMYYLSKDGYLEMNQR
jgi:hypothetical protein